MTKTNMATIDIFLSCSEIDEVQYLETLRQLLFTKSEQIDSENEFVRKDKIASYAIQKGYEAELVWKLLKESQQR